MKKLILILIITAAQIGCYAQKKLKDGTVSVNGNFFVIKKSEAYKASKTTVHFLHVHNASKNKYKNILPQPKDALAMPILKSDKGINDGKIRAIFDEVLSKKISILRENKEALSVQFVFEQTGQISNIDFSLDSSTIISAEELALIDTRLRNEVKAHLKGPDYKNFPVIPYNLTIRFY